MLCGLRKASPTPLSCFQDWANPLAPPQALIGGPPAGSLMFSSIGELAHLQTDRLLTCGSFFEFRPRSRKELSNLSARVVNRRRTRPPFKGAPAAWFASSGGADGIVEDF